MRMDPDLARDLVAGRRAVVTERIGTIEGRLAAVRRTRNDWTDEEHDPEGFAVVGEWSQAEGARADYAAELDELAAADARIDAGVYGVCVVCGGSIPTEQLERSPARTRCVGCTG